MINIRLSLSCGDYDRTRHLIDGKVAVPGLDLDEELVSFGPSPSSSGSDELGPILALASM